MSTLKRAIEIATKAEPKDESEKQIVNEIKEIKAKGHIVWIPSD